MDERKTFELNFRNQSEIYRAYMPFVRGGALFLATKEDLPMGTELDLTVQLPDFPEVIAVAGTVVWSTPTGAQGGRKPGVGVQFSGEKADMLRKKIDTFVAGMRNNPDPTDTM